MWLYAPTHWNIARRFFLAVTALSLLAYGNASPSDADWYSQTLSQSFDNRGKPSVTISETSIGDEYLTCTIHALPGQREGNTIAFIMAAPAGKISSATLTIDALTTPTDEAVTDHPVYLQTVSPTTKDVGYVRNLRLIKVSFPAVIPGLTGREFQSGRLTLAFSAGTLSPLSEAHASPLPVTNFLHDMVKRLVANPTDVDRFALSLESIPEPLDTQPSPPLGAYPTSVAGFSSEETGFAQFTGADLAACGIDIAATPPDSVTLWSDGIQVPMRVKTANPQQVSPGDRFLLYARDSASTYTLQRAYRICIGAAKPLRLTLEGNSSPAAGEASNAYFLTRKLIEQDTPPVVTRNDQFLSILDYRWVWWTWTAQPTPAIPGGITFQQPGIVHFDAEGLTSAPTMATLKLHFYTHHWKADGQPLPVKVDLNGHNLGQANIADGPALTHTFTVPLDKLKSTSNTLTLSPQTTATADLPDLCFDRLELDYPRSFTMTSDTLRFHAPDVASPHVTITPDPTSTGVIIADVSADIPRILAETSTSSSVSVAVSNSASAQYLSANLSAVRPLNLQPVTHTADLHSKDNQADLVVISWPDFIEDMKPWIEHKQAAGHKIRVIDVRDIYEQFGYGNASPHAIRAFLRHAAIHWQGSAKGPAASSILLVGDSTSAYRNEFRNDVINYVPTMRITNTSDPYASDQWYVCTFGNDFLADALIGRFSVNNKEDLRRIVSRQLAYESTSPTGPWQNTLGFIADHSEFAPAIERVMQKAVPPRFFIKKVLMDELPWIDNYYFPKELADARQAKVSQEATARIRDIFNQGASVVTYFGHGSPNIWGNERMWFGGDSPNSDNLLLTNADRLPLVINMTCNSGAIDYPQPRWNICISEDFMRATNGGAIACFVPSGPGLTVQHERLMMEIGWLLFKQNSLTLGQNLQLALWKYLTDDNPPELARMFILLGDPLLQLKLAEPATADLTSTGTSRFHQLITYNTSTDPGLLQAWSSPLSVPPADHSSGIAVSADGGTSGTVQSTALPAYPLRSMQLIQWQQSLVNADPTSTETTKITFRLRNNAPLAARSAYLEVTSNHQTIGKSQPADILPFSELTLPVFLQAPPGFTPLEAWLVNGSDRIPLTHETPIAVTRLRPDTQRDSIPPAIADPRSISIRYREVGGSIMATVNAQVYMLAREPLSNLRIALEGPDSQLVPKSEIAVPPVSPGGSTRVTLSADVTSQTTGLYRLRFDPTGLYPEFRKWPGDQVTLGQQSYGDLVIDHVGVQPASPTDGETIFLDVAVRNAGTATVDGIKVEAFRLNAANTLEPLKSQPYREPRLLNLDPGASETIRLRWDPFRNAGENRLQFTAASVYNSPDANPADNTRSITVKARTKADIRSEGVGWLPLTPEDRAARQVRFVAKVRNHGETPAYGLKVSFYSEKSRAPETYLGDVDLDVVQPGETREAVYTYKPKAGEENKAFHITCEIMFKGSRQRTPLN